MACLNSDGSLTVVAASLLGALAAAGDPAQVAAATGLPLYRVRAGLRELAEAGFVEVRGSTYGLTEQGTATLARSHAATA